MAVKKFVLNRKGVQQYILKAPWMASHLKGIAAEKARQCGDGYGSDVFTGKTRVNASIYPSTAEAARDNFKNNTIEKVGFTKVN